MESSASTPATQTYYDDISKEIEYTKTQYETKETVEKMTFDSVTGNAIE